jgi:SAM-dependent methyltransferase
VETPYASGSGDGAITADGCAVELYRRLSAGGEIDLVKAFAPAGGSILDLGAGAGRLANPLSAAGFAVTAVDQSAEMLAEIRGGAGRVRSTIEKLDLGAAFDVVLLASYLLNTPAPESRAALLATCARHLKPDGAAMVQVRAAGILRDLSGFEREAEGIRDWVEAYRRDGPVVTMTVRTECEGRRWVQTFTQRYLEEADLRRELIGAGLQFDRWLDQPPEWFLARLSGSDRSRSSRATAP